MANSRLEGACLVGAAFRGANMHASIFRRVKMASTGFERTDLSECDFRGTEFNNAILQGAILWNTKLEGADLAFATLTGADLGSAQPWQAKLFEDRHGVSGSGEQPVAMKQISSVADLIGECRSIQSNRHDCALYFRGEGKIADKDGKPWKLEPSLMRNAKLRANERNMPLDFSIGVIANFAKLSRVEQNLLLGVSDWSEGWEEDPQAVGTYSHVMQRLYDLIRQEKPAFEEKIDPRDFYRVFVVEPQQSFARIRAQAGAFLVSAFHERFERERILEWNSGIPAYGHFVFEVKRETKEHMSDELQLLNVTRESLYPGLDEAAKSVTDAHSK